VYASVQKSNEQLAPRHVMATTRITARWMKWQALFTCPYRKEQWNNEMFRDIRQVGMNK
jgi:hypothetical protein